MPKFCQEIKIFHAKIRESTKKNKLPEKSVCFSLHLRVFAKGFLTVYEWNHGSFTLDLNPRHSLLDDHYLFNPKQLSLSFQIFHEFCLISTLFLTQKQIFQVLNFSSIKENPNRFLNYFITNIFH